MKSLEETIKLKCKFLGCTMTPLYFLPAPIYFPRIFELFASKNNIETNNEITLMEEMTPLLVYLFSCIEYSRSHYIDLFFKLHFEHSELILENNNMHIFEDMRSDPLRFINENIDKTKSLGYYSFFSEPFRLEIFVEQHIVSPYLEDVIESPFVVEEKEEKEETINDLKTFNLEHCVICLDNIPNVLFCNCGHLCVCESCIKKFTKCPICKKENSVLRIIE